MKQKLIFKISFFIVLFIGIITLTGCNKLNVVTSYVYDDTNYSVGNKAFGFSIDTINIDWIAGNVYIIQSSNSEIIIREDVDIEIEDQYRMHYLYEDGVLNVKYTASIKLLEYTFKTKDLYLMLPATANEININNVSSDIHIQMVNINDLDIDNVSGYINIEDTTVNELEIENISGEIILFDNYMNVVDIDTVSGNVGLSFKTLPNDIDVSSTSAIISIYMKETESLGVEFETVSGELRTNLEYTKVDDYYNFNNSILKYEVDTVSGDLKILKK